MNNKIMLITYPDSLGENIREMAEALNKHFKRAIGSVHILPFFPSSGDRGFAPMTYEKVDPAFGDWDDIKKLSENYELMFDFMINHLSRQSDEFKDFLKYHEASEYRDLFLRYKNFWPHGEPAEEDVELIYKRHPHAPYILAGFKDGTSEKVWCTFSEEQIDLDLRSDVTWRFIEKSIKTLIEKGVSVIRLDAFAFATKKVGTNCFFVEPEVWDILKRVADMVEPYGVRLLPEIHEHYTIQLKQAERGYWVYDFALPLLTLHTLYKGNGVRLKNWLKICPRKQYTTLDTHDGIGVVDCKDLMTEEEMLETTNLLYERGANVKKDYNTTAYNNLDVYQINCTYYSALGDNDEAYLLARAIQFFAPGIPQVYHVGLLAGPNDVELMERTKLGRNINRHNYTIEEIDENMKRPVVQKLVRLMEFRNEYPAFAGDCIVSDTPDDILEIKRRYNSYQATLHANLKDYTFTIAYTGQDGKEHAF